MTPDSLLDFAQSAIITLLWVTGPVMLIALAVGLVIALIQALTSIQEITLTFVPKILIVFVALIFLLPMMAMHLNRLGTEVFTRIAAGG